MWTCRPSVHTVRRPSAGPRFEPRSGGLEPGTLTSRPPHLSVDHCTYCILKKRLLYLLPGWAIVDRVFWDGGGVGHVRHVARLRDHVVLHLQKKAVVTRKNPLYKFRKKCFVCISFASITLKCKKQHFWLFSIPPNFQGVISFLIKHSCF